MPMRSAVYRALALALLPLFLFASCRARPPRPDVSAPPMELTSPEPAASAAPDSTPAPGATAVVGPGLATPAPGTQSALPGTPTAPGTASALPTPPAPPTYVVEGASWQSSQYVPNSIRLTAGDALALVEVRTKRSGEPNIRIKTDSGMLSAKVVEQAAKDDTGTLYAMWFVVTGATGSVQVVDADKPDVSLRGLDAPGSVKVQAYDSFFGEVIDYRPSKTGGDIRMCDALQHASFPVLPQQLRVSAAQTITSRSFRVSRFAACDVAMDQDPRRDFYDLMGRHDPVDTDEGYSFISSANGYTIVIQAYKNKKVSELNGAQLVTADAPGQMAVLVCMLAEKWNFEVSGDDDAPYPGPKGNVSLTNVSTSETVTIDGKVNVAQPQHALINLHFAATSDSVLKAAMDKWSDARLLTASGRSVGPISVDKANGIITFDAQAFSTYPDTLSWFGKKLPIPLP